MTNTTDYGARSNIRRTGERLDETMTAADVVETLKRLKFEERFRLIEVHAAIRDFLVRAVTALRRK